MSDTIISVEGLGKKYRISHQGERPRYVALRDVIAEKAKRLFRRNPLRNDRGEGKGEVSNFPKGSAGVPPAPFGDSPKETIKQSSGGTPADGNRDGRAPQTSDHSSLVTRRSSEDFWALKDVSFEVKRGEVVGIIGRNGAGKSTLLKILSRITEPTTGRVTLRGRVASLLEVGTGFHPELTGRENIFLNGAILGMSRAEIRQKFDEIVAFAEVEKFLDTPVKRYSSGMYVRLAFAVAAHLEPEILIVDEVLAVGDAEFQKKCLGKMQDVAKGGRTVLFVSHNMSAVRNLCDRGLLLVQGQKHFDGSAEETILKYSSSIPKDSGLSWNRPDYLSRNGIAFETINATLLGQQPRLQLKCNVVLQASKNGESVFIAVDVCDQLETPIMQALPSAKPFISGRTGRRHLTLVIDLPPLIPGQYILDFWIGSHFSSTEDYVKNVIIFKIDDGPSLDRSAPYSPNHGFLVPTSQCEILAE